MRSHLVTALALLLATVAPARAQFTVETVALKGAYGVILVPDNWNGSLFLYAHGYSADQRLITPFPSDLGPGDFLTLDPNGRVNLLFRATVLPVLNGYASATTTFSSVGWYVKDAIKDIETLRRYFVNKHGKPKYTYLWGHSGGGMVTSTVIEYFPKTYAGAAPLCGPAAGGRRNFNAAWDLRAVYEYVCGDVAGAQLACRVCSDGRSRCLDDSHCPGGQTCGAPEPSSPPELGLSRECTDFLLANPATFTETPTDVGGGFVEGPVTTCFGPLDAAAARTPEQAGRRDLFLRASQIPEDFIGTDMFFASIGMAEVVHRRNRGKHPWGNAGVEYNPPALSAGERAALNAGIPRTREDAAAVRYMRRYYEPRGRTQSKVLTVHALDDGLVIPENENTYRDIFDAAGRSDQLVQLYTSAGGHCGFINELLPSLNALTAWVERGQKPTVASVQATCAGCSLVDRYRAAPSWGLRSPERRQKGVPARAYVCGEDADCPTGATCNVARHRCQ